MSDGILKTHGAMLATIGGFLLLVVVLVGEQDSPGVLSDVQEQADQAAASGQLQKPDWFGTDPAAPLASSVLERSDGVGENQIMLNDGALAQALPAASARAARQASKGPPASVVGRSDLSYDTGTPVAGSSRRDASGQPIPWSEVGS